MAITTCVVAGARAIRTTTVVLAVMVLVGLVAVQAFMAQYGDPTVATVVDIRASDDRISVAVAAQEAAGLRCSERPTLTDVVLFQDADTHEVTVMAFDRAIAESAARSGWVRRYCV